VSKVRKRSRETYDNAEIFSDEDFDADDFVVQMDERHYVKADKRPGWRRLEVIREERQLRRQLDDLADWDDFSD